MRAALACLGLLLCAGAARAQRLASVGADGAVRLWNLSGDAPPAEILKVPAADARTSAVSPDGRWLALAGASRAIRLFSLPDGKPARTVEGPDGGVASVAFSVDGTLLVAAGSGPAVRLWKVADGAPALTIPDAHPGGALVAQASDTQILSAGKDDVLTLWDAKGARQFTIETDHLAGLTGIASSLAGQKAFTWGADGQLKMWSVAGFHEMPDDARAPIRAAVVTPDGNRLFAAGGDGTLKAWDLTRRERVLRVAAHGAQPVVAVAVSPDGRWVATGGADKAVRLWSVADAAPGKSLPVVHAAAVVAVHFVPEPKPAPADGGK